MSPKLDAVQKFKETLETGNFDLVTPFMLDDFTHEMFPKALGVPKQSKEQWKVNTGKTVGAFKTIKVNLHNIVESPGAVALQSTMETSGPDVTGEFVFFFRFENDEAGVPRISSISEFVDSQLMAQLLTMISPAAAQ
ncbi:hypothetical protein BDM02DRAFT_3406 [Thelephora ganbajun]|uniref:Uncharacterized protein n=1 Tax=Thelephora ganbajun TaxID=370292 RepID=A0ACB6ZXI3_THEGA|nr:hypothetical protein BDM02DRAFT_3406 [Thelephora ganbajun]